MMKNKKEVAVEAVTDTKINPLLAAITKVDKEEQQRATNQIADILRTLKEMKNARVKAKNRVAELCKEFEIEFDMNLLKDF